MAYCISWTGLDCTGLVKRRLVKRELVKRGLVKRGLVKRVLVKRGLVKRGLRIGSCGRLFFLKVFPAFVNRIKLNGEQTFTKTNLRLKILFIYFQAVLFRRFSERNNPCLTFQLQKGFICTSYKQFKKLWPRRNCLQIR